MSLNPTDPTEQNSPKETVFSASVQSAVISWEIKTLDGSFISTAVALILSRRYALSLFMWPCLTPSKGLAL